MNVYWRQRGRNVYSWPSWAMTHVSLTTWETFGLGRGNAKRMIDGPSRVHLALAFLWRSRNIKLKLLVEQTTSNAKTEIFGKIREKLRSIGILSHDEKRLEKLFLSSSRAVQSAKRLFRYFFVLTMNNSPELFVCSLRRIKIWWSLSTNLEHSHNPRIIVNHHCGWEKQSNMRPQCVLPVSYCWT